jgi:PhnB protein
VTPDVTPDQAPPVNAVPDHLHTVTARLVVGDGPAAIEFYGRAFGATPRGGQFLGPNGELIHAEIQIGDSVVMVTGDMDHEGPTRSPDSLGGVVTALLCLYWEDVDTAWDRAVAAGAEVVFPLENQFYGERGGRLRDPWGQQWMMSQHIEDVSPEEMAVRAAAFFVS